MIRFRYLSEKKKYNFLQERMVYLLNQLHRMKNPWAVGETSVQCRNCGHIFTAQMVNCFDTLLWQEAREILDEENFFYPLCPQCQTQTEISYRSRYIDRELGIAAVMIPGAEKQDMEGLLQDMNRFMDRLALPGMEHRVVGNFYAMAEQMRIHKHRLNDRAIQLLKPFMIGGLQSRGFEVWDGFFTGIMQPKEAKRMDDTVYFSLQEDDPAVYSEMVYQFHIYLTNGDIIPHGINDTAYGICMNILQEKELAEDDGLFHFYDLSWAIDMHNSL